jgi:O-antigen ligase
MIIALLISTILATTALFYTSYGKRVSAEIKHIKEYYDYSHDSFPATTFGYRLHVWAIGIESINTKPLIGYGGESRKDVITGFPKVNPQVQKWLHHFHNSWLEFGVAYGLLGIIQLTYLFYWLLSKLVSRSLQKQQKQTFTMMALAAIIYTLGVNIFESYLFFWQGTHLLIWVAAPLIANSFCRKIQTKHEEGKTK